MGHGCSRVGRVSSRASTLAAASARGNRAFGDGAHQNCRGRAAATAREDGAMNLAPDSPRSRARARSRSSPARAPASGARAPRRSPPRARGWCSPGLPTLGPSAPPPSSSSRASRRVGVACDVTDAAQLRRLVATTRRPVGPDRHRPGQRRCGARPARRRGRARANGPHVRAARAGGRGAGRAHAAGHRRRRRGSVPRSCRACRACAATACCRATA